MSICCLAVGELQRRLADGTTESLDFRPGVNLLVGRPNTGKTKWLKTLDWLLGDSGDNPFEGADEEGLAEKYDAARVELFVGDERFWIERRWREPNARTKIFVDSKPMLPREFQELLLEKLSIPILHFPKGNPMSGQTWPELSFRMLLRHIHRQQRFWGGIADQQPEGEQHAVLLQFLGLAERLFTPEYGKLVRLKRHADQLRARSEQYGSTLDALASDILSDDTREVKVTLATIGEAEDRLAQEGESLRRRRASMLASARDRVILPTQRGRINELSVERAKILVKHEELQHRVKATAQRGEEVARYESDLASELEKINRAEDAGRVLADLRITHCPACDQKVANKRATEGHCFLCHQELPDELLIEELGVVRLRFERDRLTAESAEARDLIDLLRREEKRIVAEIASGEERLKMIESELAPAKLAISTFVQEEVSALDVALGELNERRRQLGRIAAALQIGQELEERIAKLMDEIRPLQAAVSEAARSTDFDSAASDLEDGMNEYLDAINKLKPGVWRHSPVALDISRGDFRFRIGKRRWHAALGGTDSLYFLMAYHYGLLSLSQKLQRHYPGLSIIDVPGEFAGEAVEDKENFIVQPFVDLLAREGYEGAQLIITGASFAGLQGVHRRHLHKVYIG